LYATYKSSPVIAEAMAAAPEVRFDLVIADEAHHCAGAARKPSKIVLDPEQIRARRRLFFTATPTLFGPKQKERARKRERRAGVDGRPRAVREGDLPPQLRRRRSPEPALPLPGRGDRNH
jgi:hypothetical protein